MRTNQSGSIAGFVIVGVVLALGAVGTFYYVGHQADFAISSEPEVVTPAPTATEDEGPAQEAPAEEASPAEPTPTPEEEVAPDDEAAPDTSQNTATNSPPSSVDELSRTGPAESISVVLALGGLTFMTVSYLLSRKRVSSL